MIPKSIYQLLPYIYISLGMLCLLIVESRLILFSSVLLIAAGGLVLLMRHNNADDSVESVNSVDDDSEIILDESSHPFDHERRVDDDRGFPLLDNRDAMIAFDRRKKQSDNKD
ncbi:MAG: hypothetical protein OEY66_00420 [Gammaproteobacteria bacterium]|nr:hypothetical protein [Gammaproteobacteria bacterium]